MRTEKEVIDRLVYVQGCIIQCAIENHGWVDPEMLIEKGSLEWFLGADNLVEKDTDDSPTNPFTPKGSN